MVKPKRRLLRDADYICFGVAPGAPDVIHGEQIAPRHKMRAWLFLNRSPSHRWLYGHSYCDTCVCGIVISMTYCDTLVTIGDTIAILRSRYNTRIAGPSIAMHRCIDASLRPYIERGSVLQKHQLSIAKLMCALKTPLLH